MSQKQNKYLDSLSAKIETAHNTTLQGKVALLTSAINKTKSYGFVSAEAVGY
jgi:hypothetical protein